MSHGWFQRAAAAFSRSEPTPQWFDVGCDCGARLKGERAEQALKPSCPACGTVVFILPAATYPIPPSLRQRWMSPEALAAGAAAAGKAPPAKPRRSAGGGSSRRSPEEKPSPAAVGPRPASATLDKPAHSNHPSLEVVRRRWWTPVRGLACALALGFGLTGYIVYRQVRWDRAQSALQVALDEGAAALEKHHFPEANLGYTRAVAALNVLGRGDSAAEVIRRRQAELSVISVLGKEPYSDRVRNWLARNTKENGSSSFSDQDWQLFDASITVSPPSHSGQPAIWQVDVPLQVGDTPVQLQVREGSVLSRFVKLADEPRRVLMAAQMERAELPADERAPARIWLNPRTLLLLSDEQVYAAVWEVSAGEKLPKDVQDILQQQRDFLETPRDE